MDWEWEGGFLAMALGVHAGQGTLDRPAPEPPATHFTHACLAPAPLPLAILFWNSSKLRMT